MAQTTQIVPKFSFPYVETVINDYTVQNDNEAINGVDPSIRMAYAVVAGKGIDNVWVKKKTYRDAVKTFGNSDFRKFGQPYMQALEVLKHENSKCWIMRVMPNNATYSNAVTSIYYKADTAEEVPEAHLRKFRIKHTSKTYEGIQNHSDLVLKGLEFDGTTLNDEYGNPYYKDAEGYKQGRFSIVRYAGRGRCGDLYSMRISKPYTYEKEYGISMYNFEILTSESGLTKDANYIGSLVSSTKYGTETTTLINDILDETEAGVAPVVVNINEEVVEEIYNAYIEFCKQLHEDLEKEYEEKFAEFDIPEDQLNGTAEYTGDNETKVKILNTINELIDRTSDISLPDIDCFDPIFGEEVGTSGEKIPMIAFPKKLTDDVDVTAEDYNELDYTETENLVDFSSAKGLVLEHGTNGYFDEPRVVVKCKNVKYTLEEEITECYKNAFMGNYDKRILSSRRIDLSVFFDANYPFEIKEILADLALVRNSCRCHLDCGIIESLSTASLQTLIAKYRVFQSYLISKDIHNYQVRESSTNKKCRVTISYFLAPAFVDHVTAYGFHIPFVKEYCQLSGHVKDSLLPVIEEYDTDLKEILYDNRFNYFEALSETELQRAVQNTCQVAVSDLLEENNVRILYELKNSVERDIQGELYNFSDEATRQSFIEYEKAKYAPWIGTILESFNIRFQTSRFEFNKSILHAYIEIVFRGLNKKAIVEIDINKRQYVSQVDSED